MGLELAAFVIALGFVSSAVLHAADYAVRGRPPELAIRSTNITHIMYMFAYCMFMGPYLVIDRGLEFWREGRIDGTIFAFCMLVSVIWSFCAGVFVAQLLIIAGVINA